MPATLDKRRAPALAGLTVALSTRTSAARLPARGDVSACVAPRAGAIRTARPVRLGRTPHAPRPDALPHGGPRAGIPRPGRRTAVVIGFPDSRT
ncbi:hypothetical protein ACIGBL_00540 [Streptomyces sp. NPDC085614]|uniref:hypothetical protein n=1 Tax=Streptomyces sp. NPDC085614 TaxID=3365733 RepID=UPI0037D3E4C5